MAVIGTNGSGKSTLARHMNALLLPTRGDLLVEGMSVLKEENMWNIRQKVGMVFQNPDNQIVAAVVEEDVAFGPENLGVPPVQIRERVDHALERVGMTAYRKHSPAMLSGGQKQRVAIARAYRSTQRVLLMDEPFGALDAQTRTQLQQELLETWEKEQKTCFFITHDVEEAIILAQRVVIMCARPGRVKEIVDIDIPYPRKPRDEDELTVSGAKELTFGARFIRSISPSVSKYGRSGIAWIVIN